MNKLFLPAIFFLLIAQTLLSVEPMWVKDIEIPINELEIRDAEFDGNNNILVSISNRIEQRSIIDGELINTFEFQTNLEDLEFNSDYSILFVSARDGLFMYNYPSMELVKDLSSFNIGTTLKIKLSPNDKHLAICNQYLNEIDENVINVRVINVEEDTSIDVTSDNRKWYFIDWNSTGELLAVGEIHNPGKIIVFNSSDYSINKEFTPSSSSGNVIINDLHFAKNINEIGILFYTDQRYLEFRSLDGTSKDILFSRTNQDINFYRFNYLDDNYILVSDVKDWETTEIHLFNKFDEEVIWTSGPNSVMLAGLKTSPDKKYILGFTADFLGVVDLTTTSINEKIENLPFPNPTSSKLNLGKTYSEILIKDIFGKLVLMDLQKDQIDVSHLTPGVYFLYGDSVVYKFVKE